MADVTEADAGEEPDPFDAFRQFFALEGDVLVLSLSLFAFSLGFQMTGRYLPQYLSVLGAGSLAIGLYGSVGNLISAVYPYPGGALSDRVGSRLSLTLFGFVSTVGFVVWYLADGVAEVVLGPWATPTVRLGSVVLLDGRVGPVNAAVVLVFLGLFCTQAWKSFGLGATFAVVKQSVAADRLATGFAATETFRRTAFLLGPLFAAAAIAAVGFRAGFGYVLLVAAGFGAVATVAQHVLYDAGEDTVGSSFEGVETILADLRSLPDTLRPLLVADVLVRFANGMVYVFFVIVVVDFLDADATLPVVGHLAPEAFFGVLLGVEMAVALVSMLPVSKLSRAWGLKPTVALGFAVYALFPALLVSAPANQWVLVALFAFSGLRFAGLPAHKALIVGPAEAKQGGRVVGSYYLLRNVVVIPSAALGGWLYGWSPTAAFGTATAVGLVGVAYFLLRGREFEAYA